MKALQSPWRQSRSRCKILTEMVAEWRKRNNCFNGKYNNCSNKYHGQSQSSSIRGILKTFTVLLHSHVIQGISYCFIFRRNVNFPNESHLNIVFIRRLRDEQMLRGRTHIRQQPWTTPAAWWCYFVSENNEISSHCYDSSRQYPVQIHLFPY